jgi:hypothetical protein
VVQDQEAARQRRNSRVSAKYVAKRPTLGSRENRAAEERSESLPSVDARLAQATSEDRVRKHRNVWPSVIILAVLATTI